jgi:imidazole glycerol-phosphate synthase subunit HisH
MKETSGFDRQIVTVIDLNVQNILSVENAFRVVGADVKIARVPAELNEPGLLVLPGVGAFGIAMERLKQTGLHAAIKAHASRGLPVLGLCLGMQLLADTSEEFGSHQGLGLIPGQILRLEDEPPEYRVPNIGWRKVDSTDSSSVFASQFDGRDFYHVHSFHFQCTHPEDVAATSRFGKNKISSVVHRGKVIGTQFHPEKSQDAGLDFLHSVWRTMSAPL